jgi:hypothetical protein
MPQEGTFSDERLKVEGLPIAEAAPGSGDVAADPWIERWVCGMSPRIVRMPSWDEPKSRWNLEMSSQIPGSSGGSRDVAADCPDAVPG